MDWSVKIKNSHSNDMETVPLWSISHTKNETEYLEFEVYAEELPLDDVETKENSLSHPCHICEVDVPACYLDEHNNSETHRMFKMVANVALERVRKQMALITTTAQKPSGNTYYCQFCAKSVAVSNKTAHENSTEHSNFVLQQKAVETFLKSYNNSDKLASIRSKHDDGIEEILVCDGDDKSSEQQRIVKPFVETCAEANKTNAPNNEQLIEASSNCANCNEEHPKPEHVKETHEIEINSEDVLKEIDNDDDENTKGIKEISKHFEATRSTNVMETDCDDVIEDIDEDNSDKQIYMQINDETYLDEGFSSNSNKKSDLAAYLTILKDLGVNNVTFIDDNFIEITTLSGGVVKVLKNNFHSYQRFNKTTKCNVCDKIVDNRRSHVFDIEHMRRIMSPVEDVHCIRKITETLSDCILCNVIVKDNAHMLQERHCNLSKKAIIKDDTKASASDPHNEIQTIDIEMETPATLNELDEAEAIKSIVPENVVKNENGCDTEQGKPEKKEVIIDNYCNVCDRYLLDTNKTTLKQHKGSMKHRLNLWLATKDEKIHWHMSSCGDEAKCKICGIQVFNNKDEINGHVNSEEHKLNYKIILKANEIKIIDDYTTACTVCNQSFLAKDAISHIKTKRHRMSMFAQLLYIFKATADKDNIICSICDIAVPYIEQNMREHLNSSTHQKLIKAMLRNNKMKRNSCGQCYCEICDKKVKIVNEYVHVKSDRHINNLKYHHKNDEARCSFNFTNEGNHSLKDALTILPKKELDKVKGSSSEEDVANKDSLATNSYSEDPESINTLLKDSFTILSKKASLDKEKGSSSDEDVVDKDSLATNSYPEDSESINTYSRTTVGKAISKDKTNASASDPYIKKRSTDIEIKTIATLKDIVETDVNESIVSGIVVENEHESDKGQAMPAIVQVIKKSWDNKARCKICNIQVSDETDDHVNSEEHNFNFKKILQANDTSFIDDFTTACSHCDVTFLAKDAINHFKTKTHKAGMYAKLLHIFQKTPKEDKIRCIICNITIPYAKHNISKHRNSPAHLVFMNDLLTKNKMKRNGCGQCYCDVCNIVIKIRNEYDHVMSKTHLQKLDYNDNNGARLDNLNLTTENKHSTEHALTIMSKTASQDRVKSCSSEEDVVIKESLGTNSHLEDLESIKSIYSHKTFQSDKSSLSRFTTAAADNTEVENDGYEETDNINATFSNKIANIEKNEHNLTQTPRATLNESVIKSNVVEYIFRLPDKVVEYKHDTESKEQGKLEISKRKKIIADNYCTVCDKLLPKTDKKILKVHKDSLAHKLKSWLATKDDKIHWHMKSCGNMASCKICDIKLSKTKDIINDHVTSEEHELNYKKFLEENLIEHAEEHIMECAVCNCSLLVKDTIKHTKSSQHKGNILAKGLYPGATDQFNIDTSKDVATTHVIYENPTEQVTSKTQLSNMFTMTHELYSIKCKLCDTLFPYSQKNMETHVKSFDHQSLFNAMLVKNKISRNSSVCYCELCNVILKSSKGYIHTMKKGHINKLKSISFDKPLIDVRALSVKDSSTTKAVIKELFVTNSSLQDSESIDTTYQEDRSLQDSNSIHIQTTYQEDKFNSSDKFEDEIEFNTKSNNIVTGIDINNLVVTKDCIEKGVTPRPKESHDKEIAERTNRSLVLKDENEIKNQRTLKFAAASLQGREKTEESKEAIISVETHENDQVIEMIEHETKIVNTLSAQGETYNETKEISEIGNAITFDDSAEILGTVEYLMHPTENSEEVLCKICDHKVKNRADFILEHVESIKHEFKYQSYLLTHKLKETWEDFVCEVCSLKIEKDQIFLHVISKEHCLNLRATSEECEEQISANPISSDYSQHRKQFKQLCEIKQRIVANSHKQYLMEPFSDAELYCKLCDAEFTNSKDRLKEHIMTDVHLGKFEALLYENEMKRVDGKTVCEVCRTDVIDLLELDHVYSSDHASEISTTVTKKEKKAIKKNKSLYFICSLCNIEVKCEPNSMKIHNGTDVHKNNMLKPQIGKTMCEICNVEVRNTGYGMRLHLKEHEHKKNATLINGTNSTTQHTTEINQEESVRKTNAVFKDVTNCTTQIATEIKQKESINLPKPETAQPQSMPAIKKDQRAKLFNCVVCNTTFNTNPNTIIAHYDSKLHKDNAKLFLIQQSEKQTQPSSSFTNIIETTEYKELLAKGFCNVCKSKVPINPHHVKEHLRGRSHKSHIVMQNTKVSDYLIKTAKNCATNNTDVDTAKIEPMQHLDSIPSTSLATSISDTTEYKELLASGFCNACKSKVPMNTHNLKEHLRGSSHKNKVVLQNPKVKDNIVTTTAKNRVTNNTDENNSKTEPMRHLDCNPSTSLITSITNTTEYKELLANGFCKICRSRVPPNAHNVREHLIGTSHKNYTYLQNINKKSTEIIATSSCNKTNDNTSIIDPTTSHSFKNVPTNQSNGNTLIKLSRKEKKRKAKEEAEINAKMYTVNNPGNIQTVETSKSELTQTNKNNSTGYITAQFKNTEDAGKANTNSTVNLMTDTTNKNTNIDKSSQIINKNIFRCNICKVDMQNTKNNIACHLNSPKHTQNLLFCLQDNDVESIIPPLTAVSNTGTINTVASNNSSTEDKDIMSDISTSTTEAGTGITKKSNDVNEACDVELIEGSATSDTITTKTTCISDDAYIGTDVADPDTVTIKTVISEKVTNADIHFNNISTPPDDVQTTINNTNEPDFYQENIGYTNDKPNSADSVADADNRIDTKEILTTMGHDLKQISEETIEKHQDAIKLRDPNDTNEEHSGASTSHLQVVKGNCEKTIEEPAALQNVSDLYIANSDQGESKDVDVDTTDDGAGYYVCNLCDYRVKNSIVEIKSHLTSFRHNSNLEQRKEKEKEGVDIHETYFCEICNEELDRNAINIKNHLESGSHSHWFEIVLKNNGIQMKGKVCYCELCDLYFNKYSVEMHIKRESHKSFLM